MPSLPTSQQLTPGLCQPQPLIMSSPGVASWPIAECILLSWRRATGTLWNPPRPCAHVSLHCVLTLRAGLILHCIEHPDYIQESTGRRVLHVLSERLSVVCARST